MPTLDAALKNTTDSNKIKKEKIIKHGNEQYISGNKENILKYEYNGSVEFDYINRNYTKQLSKILELF